MIPEALRGLAAEARKCATFEEFEHAFLGQIKHGTYWHWTDDPNFRIDPAKGPRDMSSMGGGYLDIGKLMITSDLRGWSHYGDRKYAALIDMSDVDPKDYYQVKRGFGNEFIVSDPSKARVQKVYYRARAFAVDKERAKALPQSSEALKAFYDSVVRKATPMFVKESPDYFYVDKQEVSYDSNNNCAVLMLPEVCIKEAPPPEPEVSLDRMQRDTYDLGWEQGELLKAFIRRTKSSHDRPSSAALGYLKKMYKAWKSGDANADSYASLIDDMLGRQYRSGLLVPSESHTSFTRFLKETPNGFRTGAGNSNAHWSDSFYNASAILDHDQKLCFVSLCVHRPRREDFQTKLLCVDTGSAEVLAEFDIASKLPLIHGMILCMYRDIEGCLQADEQPEWFRKVLPKGNKIPPCTLAGSHHNEYQYRLFDNDQVLSAWLNPTKDNAAPTAKFVRMWNTIAGRYGQHQITGKWLFDASGPEENYHHAKMQDFIPLSKYLGDSMDTTKSPDLPRPRTAGDASERPDEVVRRTREALGLQYGDLLNAYYRRMAAMPECGEKSAMVAGYFAIRARYQEWRRGEVGLDSYEQMLHDTIWQLYTTGRLHESKKKTDYARQKRKLMHLIMAKSLNPIKRCKTNGIDAYFLGTIDGLGIFAVDGDAVKLKYFPDYIEGGNSKIYSFMPPNSVWIDGNMKRDSWKPILMHEMLEYYMVDRWGLSYDTAHEMANVGEMELRVMLDKMAGKKPRVNPNIIGRLLAMNKDDLQKAKQT